MLSLKMTVFLIPLQIRHAIPTLRPYLYHRMELPPPMRTMWRPTTLTGRVSSLCWCGSWLFCTPGVYYFCVMALVKLYIFIFSNVNIKPNSYLISQCCSFKIVTICTCILFCWNIYWFNHIHVCRQSFFSKHWVYSLSHPVVLRSFQIGSDIIQTTVLPVMSLID